MPGGLERIGMACLMGAGLEEVRLPASVRTVGCRAFASCERLCGVRLNEGLEALGREELFQESVFMRDALESVIILSTLGAAEPSVFEKCRGVKMVEFLGEGKHWEETGRTLASGTRYSGTAGLRG